MHETSDANTVCLNLTAERLVFGVCVCAKFVNRSKAHSYVVISFRRSSLKLIQAGLRQKLLISVCNFSSPMAKRLI